MREILSGNMLYQLIIQIAVWLPILQELQLLVLGVRNGIIQHLFLEGIIIHVIQLQAYGKQNPVCAHPAWISPMMNYYNTISFPIGLLELPNQSCTML